ncbi:MAG: 5-formyltetrahydrofolate cyclo-ligase [Gemmatimonadales bacterium]|nr:MAG: 5-formyltetrahydrofolate cyclo-ligase [Gemmatimonadales bacterium]
MTDKATVRDRVLSRRAEESDRDLKSRRIAERVASHERYNRAAVVSTYVGVDSEVATIPLIVSALAAGRTVVVPWVDGDDIRLSRLDRLDELVSSGFGLLEPTVEIRTDPSRRVAPEVCEVFLVPGVAFDREGYRLGRGRGYYDRLLSQVPPAVFRIGLAFECQLVESVPREDHDQRMDLIVTEQRTYEA